MATSLCAAICGSAWPAVQSLEGRSAPEDFGNPDDLRLESAVTLLEYVAETNSVFVKVLDRVYDGGRDVRTNLLVER
ncbi:MAG: DUF1810 family protein [Anaerolineae bacterium]|nr:DUF1810 family protein [Anaerolineae bacterium]